MNAIVGEALVSCYVDVASLLAMILLLILSMRFRGLKNTSLRIFRMLSLCVTAICVLPFIHNAMYMQPAPWCHTAAIVAKTLRECFVILIVGLWLAYVYNKLYGDRNRHLAFYRLVFLPLTALFVLLIVNLFTGIVFTYSSDNRFEPKPLLYAIFAVEFLYFCLSAVIVRYYDRKMMKIRFLRVSPMIVSVLLASGTQFIAPYDIGILGYVIGITLLYFSLVSEIRFVDGESGLYNSGYMAYLFDMAIAGKNDFHSALILETDGDLPACFEILHRVLHQGGDGLHAEAGRPQQSTGAAHLLVAEEGHGAAACLVLKGRVHVAARKGKTRAELSKCEGSVHIGLHIAYHLRDMPVFLAGAVFLFPVIGLREYEHEYLGDVDEITLSIIRAQYPEEQAEKE